MSIYTEATVSKGIKKQSLFTTTEIGSENEESIIYKYRRIDPYTRTDAFTTEASSQPTPVPVVSTSSNVLGRVEGLIVGVTNDTVKIKFNDKLTTIFPLALLLRDISEPYYGQKIMYQIKKGRDGFALHEFLISENNELGNPLNTIEEVIKKYKK